MRDLTRLFNPASLAVFGGRWAHNVIEQCQQVGFAGQIWPVHPQKSEVAGLRCYPSIAALPGPPDAAYIAVNRQLTVQLVGELASAGAGGAVCFASGFEESEAEGTGGAALQKALLDAAGAMPFLGPNCYGLVNMLDGAVLWPDQHGCRSVDEGVAILTQSSNLAINMSMQTRGLPISHLVTVGNQAQHSAAEIAHWLMDDPRVRAIGLHLEGFQDVRAIERLAEKSRQTSKPVVVLKVGQSALAQQATITHSASLAGSGAGASALWKRLGFAEVRSVPQFIDALTLFHVHGILPGTALASVSCSGGEAALVADIASSHGLNLPAISASTAGQLKALLGPIVTVANPLDFHTFIWGDWDKMTAVYAAVQRDGFDLIVLITDLPRVDRCDPEDWARSVGAWIDAARQTGVRAAVAATLPENMPEWMAEQLIAEGIVPFGSIEALVLAMTASEQVRQGQQDDSAPVLVAKTSQADAGIIWHEAAAKLALKRHGVAVPEGAEVTTVAQACAVAGQIGYPVVLKITDVAHKTEQSGVRLGLGDGQAVAAAAKELFALSASLLIEQMVTDPLAELIVGVVSDPPNGFQLTLASGGILAELMSTRVPLLIPAGRDAIGAALDGLSAGTLIKGYRNQPGADRDVVLDAIQAVEGFAVAHSERLLELDINPLMITPNKAIAADALIRLRSDPR